MTRKKIKIGDTICVKQAWEDTAGHLHDEYAEVLGIDEAGFMDLKFSDKKVDKFLKGAEFLAVDYEPE